MEKECLRDRIVMLSLLFIMVLGLSVITSPISHSEKPVQYKVEVVDMARDHIFIPDPWFATEYLATKPREMRCFQCHTPNECVRNRSPCANLGEQKH